MGRDVQTYESQGEWYVPDIGDNREDPEPFMVFLHPMDSSEIEQMRQMPLMTSGKKQKHGDAIASYEVRESLLREKVFTSKITDVVRYVVRSTVTGKVMEPKDGRALYDAIMTPGVPGDEQEIVRDCYEAIKDRSVLEEGLKKNFNLPSGSSPAEMSAA